MPLNRNSIAGYVAVTDTILNIPTSATLEIGPGRIQFVLRPRAQLSKSMLVVPMRNHLDGSSASSTHQQEDDDGTGKMTGNGPSPDPLHPRTSKVVPFPSRYESLSEAVAGQAAIAIENNRMMKQIQEQFEEFVKASVTAIESRDAATSGHSFRVAELCKQMALAVNAEEKGVFGDMRFSEMAIKELEYAALLHDFGKVYIDLAIFQKSKKLFPKNMKT